MPRLTPKKDAEIVCSKSGSIMWKPVFARNSKVLSLFVWADQGGGMIWGDKIIAKSGALSRNCSKCGQFLCKGQNIKSAQVMDFGHQIVPINYVRDEECISFLLQLSGHEYGAKNTFFVTSSSSFGVSVSQYLIKMKYLLCICQLTFPRLWVYHHAMPCIGIGIGMLCEPKIWILPPCYKYEYISCIKHSWNFFYNRHMSPNIPPV